MTVTGGQRTPRPSFAFEATAAGDTVRLHFRSLGDHSPYTVTLLDGGGRALHPFFASTQFRFTIDCEVGDCRQTPERAAQPPAQPPTVDLLTKDFTGFVDLFTDWVKVHNPSITDLSAASFERLLLDLLAWASDLTSYYQDRVAAEAFIDTAAQRFSLRQQAVLLGTSVDDGQSPSTLLGMDVTKSGFVPEGIQVRVRTAPDEVPVSFVTTARTRVLAENSSSGLRVAAFPGAADAQVPAGAQELLLWGHGLQTRAGDRLVLAQGAFSQVVTLTADPVRLTAPGWVRIPSDDFDPATDPAAPVTLVRWAQPLLQALSPWSGPQPFTLVANLVDARFGIPRTAIAGGSGPVRRDQIQIDLTRRNSVVARAGSSSTMLLRSLRLPEWPVVHDDGIPAVQVSVRGAKWTRVDHLHGSRSYEMHYVAQADETGAVWLSFGDGVKGREVPLTADGRPAVRIELDYRIGDPVTGNVGLGTVVQVVRPAIGTDEQLALDALGTVTVTNVVPATGGRRPQTLDQTRQQLPASLRPDVLQRAVALGDYAAAAAQVPGVGRATARAGGGPFNAVIVLVDPEGAGGLNDVLRRRVHDLLDTVRMTGREHIVLAAEYVPLEVSLLLCAQPGFALDKVRDRVLTELRPGTAQHPGWFHPDRLSFGDAVRLGDLLAFVQDIPGVRSVKPTVFRPLGELTGPAVRDSVLLGRTKVARLDADSDLPENGTLQVRVIGLDADGSEIVIDAEPLTGTESRR